MNIFAVHVKHDSVTICAVVDIGVEVTARAVHPMVFGHPRTGRPLLLVTEMATQQVLGLSETETFELLEALCAHIYETQPTYEHEWQQNDLLILDNISLQHSRKDEANAGPRTLRRVVHAPHNKAYRMARAAA